MSELVTFQNEALAQPERKRVVILGTKVDGVYELAELFQRQLEQSELDTIEVIAERYLDPFLISFYGRETLEEGIANPNPPIGVVVMPWYRHRDPQTYMGFTFPTEGAVAETIRQLCIQHGVRLRIMGENPNHTTPETTPNLIEPGQIT